MAAAASNVHGQVFVGFTKRTAVSLNKPIQIQDRKNWPTANSRKWQTKQRKFDFKFSLKNLTFAPSKRASEEFHEIQTHTT
jgi:hypothetical protein